MSTRVKMLSLRDVNVRGLTGHTVFIPAKVPTLVPRQLVQAALDKGCIPEDEAEMLTMRKAQEEQVKEETQRLESLVDAIASIVEKNDAENDFTAGGMPKVEAVEKVVGFDIAAQERDEAWTLFMDRNKQDAPAPAGE